MPKHICGLVLHLLLITAFMLSVGSRGVAEERGVAGEHRGANSYQTFEHDGRTRKYLLHLPKDLPENAPLVFMLHGYYGQARGYKELGMDRVADLHGFAVSYPQGEGDYRGTPHWNARLEISNVDDIGFLSALAIDLQKRHKLNPAKTFTCGISNGGFMSYVLVAERPDIFKAAGSIIGTMSGYTWENREQIRPVPIIQISGLTDEVVPYDGSMSPRGGWGGAPDQDEIMKFWNRLNETKTHEVIKVSDKTMAHIYSNGVNDIEVWHYKISDFGHWLPSKRATGIDAFEVIGEFFSKY